MKTIRVQVVLELDDEFDLRTSSSLGDWILPSIEEQLQRNESVVSFEVDYDHG